MLCSLFPRMHQRYSSLRLFGPLLDDFASWLSDHGYHRDPIQSHMRATRRLERKLLRRSCRTILEIRREALRACRPKNSQDDMFLSAVITLWERYLDEQHLLPPLQATPIATLANEYGLYLDSVRNASRSTLVHHSRTISCFLSQLGYEENPSCLAEVDLNAVEAFVRMRSQSISRASLQHEIAHLRSFLRFLAVRGQVRPGLDRQIDSPRLYTGEQLPRSLSWETVQSLLASIDRTTPIGLRDYAILLLIASYGLRASEIVALKLDDIQWRAATIRIPSCKTVSPPLLPLMDAVGESLVAYLRRGRPPLPHRQVFLRHLAPAGPLKPTAVTKAFQKWVRQSGLNIPYQGPHCLRHTLAVHLLRHEVPLKTIGDLLGHRSAESTCVYIRLAVEELRDVALTLPLNCISHQTAEVHP
jgi:integrase/recombinase XerD